jgi:hypothetical protein
MEKFLNRVLALALLALAPAVHAQSFGAPGYMIDQNTVLGTLTLPTSYNYGNTFGAGATFAGGTTTTFYDDITFTVGGSVADSITSTINLGTFLGISGLQARLFNGAGPYNSATSGSFMDLAWGTSVTYAPGITGTTVVINSISLAAGTYTLEVKGTVTGTGGGSYAGVLNVAAVPEAETIGLMLLGFTVLGIGVARRRKA